MKKILIISELFYPSNRIGALRPSKICKYLLERGYDIDVLTAYPSEGIYNSEHCRVFSLNDGFHADNMYKVRQDRINMNNALVNQFRYFKRTFFSYLKGRNYAKRALVLLEEKDIKFEEYTACISTYGPISSVLIGLELKKKYRIKNWICDFRDPIVVKMSSVFMRPFYRYLQDQACKYADKIVSVSDGYIQRICGDKYLEKRYMIPNGYDVSDIQSDFIHNKSDKLTFAYAGTLYEGKRDISPIFRALHELHFENKIELSKVAFVYAGGDFRSLLSQSERSGMQCILKNCGHLSREKCLKMQYDSDILVLSTWNEKGEEGVFPGKFLEYMLIGKPIISLTCGNLLNSEVTSVMRIGNFGIAYESANDESDYVLLKDFIKTAYDSFTNTGRIRFEPAHEVLERYNYNHIIEQVEALINEE